MRWAWKIGSLFGIPVKVHLTFLLLLVLIYFAGVSVIGIGGISGVIFVILVFASVVFHELSHALVARHYGMEVVDITLLPIGGVARMPHTPESPLQEIVISAAGPSASILLAFCLWFVADIMNIPVGISNLGADGNLLSQLVAVNFVLAMFNLIPAFPMDGGRILRGALATFLSPYLATRIAVGVGQVFAIVLFFVGILSTNFFMILIALFVYLGAETEERQMGIMMSLGGATANTAMIRNMETLSPSLTVGEVAERFTHGFQADFPVVEDQRLVGLITREILIEALHKGGPSELVSTVMVRDFPTVVEDTPLVDVLQKIQDSGSSSVPVLKTGQLKGIITLEQIGRYNMLCSGYSCEFLMDGKN